MICYMKETEGTGSIDVTVVIDDQNIASQELGLKATELEHLIRILRFQTNDKGLQLRGWLNLTNTTKDE